jgi:hypothetical protein
MSEKSRPTNEKIFYIFVNILSHLHSFISPQMFYSWRVKDGAGVFHRWDVGKRLDQNADRRFLTFITV